MIGFGTSLPELLVNIIASLKGDANGIVLGNVIGSNNFNLLFILGLTGLLVPLKVQGSTIWKEIPISLLAAFVLILLANDTFTFGADANVVSRGDGAVLIFMFLGLCLLCDQKRQNQRTRK